ncbi:MAG: TolB family protein [Bacillota bacterium]
MTFPEPPGSGSPAGSSSREEGGEAQAAQLRAARSFFAAAWAGDREAAEALFAPSVVERRKEAAGNGPAWPWSVITAAETDPWEFILWQVWSERSLLREPEFAVADAGPRYATVRASYAVLIGGPSSAPPVPYDFGEEYMLERHGDEWLVYRFARAGIPRAARVSEGASSPYRRVELCEADGMLRCGPLTDLNLYYGVKWNPDGQKVAFRGDNCERMELWAVDAARGRGRCLIAVPRPLQNASGDRPELYVLGWSADGNRIFFLVAGRQTCGSHRGEEGWWVGSVPLGGGEPATVAFVPAKLATMLCEPKMTADRAAVFIHRSPDLYRVSLQDGRVDLLAGDLPSYDGLFRLYFSPDGRSAAWEFVVGHWEHVDVPMDLHTGRKVEIRRPRGVEWMGLDGWTPDGLAVVCHARRAEIVQDVDYGFPVGAQAVCLYDTAGRLRFRIEPPGGREQRIGPYAWAPDGWALAFCAGPVQVPAAESGQGAGAGQPCHLSRELWLWEKESDRYRKLADLAGPVEQVEWVVPSLIRVWYRAGPDDAVRRGLEVGGDGATRPLRDPYVHHWERIAGGTGDVAVAVRGARGRRQAVVATSRGSETVLVGGVFLRSGPLVDHGFIVFAEETDPPCGQYLRILRLPGPTDGAALPPTQAR